MFPYMLLKLERGDPFLHNAHGCAVSIGLPHLSIKLPRWSTLIKLGCWSRRCFSKVSHDTDASLHNLQNHSRRCYSTSCWNYSARLSNRWLALWQLSKVQMYGRRSLNMCFLRLRLLAGGTSQLRGSLGATSSAIRNRKDQVREHLCASPGGDAPGRPCRSARGRWPRRMERPWISGCTGTIFGYERSGSLQQSCSHLECVSPGPGGRNWSTRDSPGLSSSLHHTIIKSDCSIRKLTSPDFTAKATRYQEPTAAMEHTPSTTHLTA